MNTVTVGFSLQTILENLKYEKGRAYCFPVDQYINAYVTIESERLECYLLDMSGNIKSKQCLKYIDYAILERDNYLTEYSVKLLDYCIIKLVNNERYKNRK